MTTQPQSQAPTARVTEQGEIALWSPYTQENLKRTKSVPGFRFEGHTFYWPAIPAVAAKLAEAWRGHGLRGDTAFVDLVTEGRRLQRAQAEDAQAIIQALRAADAAAAQDDQRPLPVTNKEGWPHQRKTFWFLADTPGGMPALDMGLGKTLVTLALIEYDRQKTNSLDPVMIVAPKSVLEDAWGGSEGQPGQFDKHLRPEERQHYALLTLSGNQTTREKVALAEAHLTRAKAEGRVPVLILSYDTLIWGATRKKDPDHPEKKGKRIPGPFEAWALRRRWGHIVWDESHRLKDPGGTTSQVAATFRSRTRKVWELTGTPAPHGPEDIYAQARAVRPEVFGTNYGAFEARYVKKGGYMGREIVGYQNEEELNRKFYSFAVRVTKQQALDEGTLKLPPVMPHAYRQITLGDKARRIYESIATKLIASIDQAEAESQRKGRKVTVANALVKLIRLSQITSGFIPLDPDVEEEEPAEIAEIDNGKEADLEEFLGDLAPTEPVVVFARWSHDLLVVHRVAKKLKRGSLELSGSHHQLKEWRADAGVNKYPILATQEQAGGVGVDLTRAAYSYYFSKGFSLGSYDQTQARTHRFGQLWPTNYAHAMVRNSIDEQIQRALDTRRDIIESVLGELKEEAKTKQGRLV